MYKRLGQLDGSAFNCKNFGLRILKKFVTTNNNDNLAKKK